MWVHVWPQPFNGLSFVNTSSDVIFLRHPWIVQVTLFLVRVHNVEVCAGGYWHQSQRPLFRVNPLAVRSIHVALSVICFHCYALVIRNFVVIQRWLEIVSSRYYAMVNSRWMFSFPFVLTLRFHSQFEQSHQKQRMQRNRDHGLHHTHVFVL